MARPFEGAEREFQRQQARLGVEITLEQTSRLLDHVKELRGDFGTLTASPKAQAIFTNYVNLLGSLMVWQEELQEQLRGME